MQMHLFIKVSRLMATLIWGWNRLKPRDGVWLEILVSAAGPKRFVPSAFASILTGCGRRLENNTLTTAFEIIWSSTLDAVLSNHYKHLGSQPSEKNRLILQTYTLLQCGGAALTKNDFGSWYADSDIAQISHARGKYAKWIHCTNWFIVFLSPQPHVGMRKNVLRYE